MLSHIKHQSTGVMINTVDFQVFTNSMNVYLSRFHFSHISTVVVGKCVSQQRRWPVADASFRDLGDAPLNEHKCGMFLQQLCIVALDMVHRRRGKVRITSVDIIRSLTLRITLRWQADSSGTTSSSLRNLLNNYNYYVIIIIKAWLPTG